MLHRTKTMHAMLKSGALRESRTYLIRDEKRHGQMSFVFAGLIDGRGDPTGADVRAKGKHREVC